MSPATARVDIHRALPPEEQARADFYALLARLFRAAPDAALLRSLGEADAIPAEGDPDLAKAWRDLMGASSVMDPEAARDEYQLLFEGMGSSEVSIYSGFFTGAAAVDHPRIRLRADLRDLNLGKPDAVTEPDDHFAVLFDVMRVLIAGGAGRSPVGPDQQRPFYLAHVEPGAPKFFRAVLAAPGANYYRTVAALGAAFLAIESESFRLG